jgi:hypothetical protein
VINSIPEKSTDKASNRRASRRWPVCGHARIECRKGAFGLGPSLTLSVLNLSETGVCLVSKTPLGQGQEVEVLFGGLDAGQPLKRMARVVWSRPHESKGTCLGIRFQAALPYSSMQRLVRTT